MTGFGTVETAIEAMKKGAYDYILKPFKVEEVIHVVQRGLDRQRLQPENIRLRDALSIYKVSEAIATLAVGRQGPRPGARRDHRRGRRRRRQPAARGPEAGRPLHRADAQGLGARRARRAGAGAEPRRGAAAVPARTARCSCSGSRAYRYIAAPPHDLDRRLVSFCSIPLKLNQRIIGMLNAYCYTRGKKFDEGQRKMLSVLASRAAVSIENARLYEDLVDANKDLTRANVSLEENFKQTIIGFAHALEETDRYTRGHSERVAMYARLIARRPAHERARDRHAWSRPA